MRRSLGNRRTRLARPVAFLLPLAAVLGLASDVGAFSAPGHKWPTSSFPVLYRLEPTGSADINDGSDLDAIRNAFMTWQDVACSDLAFDEAPWMAPNVVNNEGINRVFWIEDAPSWPAQETTLALTLTFFDTSTLEISDADMIANGVHWEWTTQEGMVANRRVDVETVFFHEIGHFFGLDHSQDPTAAMFAQNNVPVRRAPANDDIAGLCTLNPNGNEIPGGSTGMPGSVGQPCQGNTDCASGLCLDDPELNMAYCTERCNRMAADCPVDFPCTSTNQGDLCLAPLPIDELCDQCSSSDQCASGICAQVPGFNFFANFCTRACDPTPGRPAQCPDGYRCEAVANGAITGGLCAPTSGVCDPQGRGGHNEPCFANGGCKPGHTCIEYFPGSGLAFCYFECTPQLAGASCSDSQRLQCLNADQSSTFGRPNIAACFNISGVGEPCIPEICEPGSSCLFDENAGLDSAICYALCPTAGCPANQQCQGLPSLGISVCVPNAGFKPLGSQCASSSECESNMCRTFGDNNLCTQNCQTTDPTSCEAGLICIAASGRTDGLCWPSRDVLPDDRGTEPPPTDPNFCACDSSAQCDRDFALGGSGGNCPCDDDCGSCGCSTTGDSATSSQLSLLSILALLVVARRRRR